MKLALAQIDTTPGDLAGNVARVRAAAERAREAGADLLVAPELAVLGYPPRDLLLRPALVEAVREATLGLARALASGPPAVVGTLALNPRPVGRALHNAAVLLRGGRIEATYAKRLLPTYDVFDERRYFAPGREAGVVEIGGRRVGLLVCEDLWGRDLVGGRRLYGEDPPGDLARAGIDLAVAIAASPYHQGKDAHRRRLYAAEARRMGVPLAVCHQVGGNDDVLFDGRSHAFDAEGFEIASLPAFEEEVRIVDLAARGHPSREPDLPPAEETRRALLMGIRGYFRKTGYRRALVGLSGGVDSAVVASLATEALGAGSVRGVAMPGPFSAPISQEDAHALATALGIPLDVLPIHAPYGAFLETLAPHLAGRAPDHTEENLQARARGVLLMALSNRYGSLVLSTGNKSEVSVGYCTLYGDMNGGLAVLSDVWKTEVYEIARIYQARGWIPERTITRPPSAELRPDQLDTDALPPYEDLDRILRQRVEEGAGLEEIVARGEDRAIVSQVLRMFERSEYKRRQMPPGLKVTPTAFGVGWRMPIARPVDPEITG